MKRSMAALPLPLTTSKLANKLPRESPKVSPANTHLRRLPRTFAHIPQKNKSESKTDEHDDVLGELMAKLNEHHISKHEGGVALHEDSSSQSTDPYANTPPAGSTATSDSNDTSTMENMKRQLELATERMAQMELELTKTRLRQASEQPVGPSYPAVTSGFPYTSLGDSNVSHHGSGSKRTSPFDPNAQPPALNVNNGFQGGGLAPPPFFAK